MDRELRLTRRRLVAVAGAAALGLLGAPSRAAARFPGAAEYGAEVATAWFDRALALVRTTPGYSPPVASRALGYTGVTLYEALLPGMPGFRSLGAPGLPATGRNAAYDWAAVANAALASILRALFPSAPAAELAAVDALEAGLAHPGPGGVLSRSAARGREAAAAVFEWSKSDGGHEGYLRNLPALLSAHRPGPLGADAARIPAGPPAVLGRQPLLRDRRGRELPSRRPSRLLGGLRVGLLRGGSRGL